MPTLCERNETFMKDIILIAVILLIIVGAGVYVYRAKKSGAHCIGCPSAKSCGGKCKGCHYSEKSFDDKDTEQ